MINVSTEQMEPLDTVKIIGNPSRPTRYRWAMRGVGSPAVVLETLTIGGRKWTSLEAIQRFIDAQNAPATSDAPAISQAQRTRQGAAACRELERIGV